MTRSIRFAISGIAFSIVSFALEEWLCLVVTGRCVGDASFFTLIVPNLIILGVFFLLGIGIASLIERISQFAFTLSQSPKFLLRLMAGGIIGYLARSIAAFFHGYSILDSLALNADHFPFAVGGIACAMVNSILFSVSAIKDGPSNNAHHG